MERRRPLGRCGHQESAPLGFDQGQRLARRQRDPLQQSQARAFATPRRAVFPATRRPGPFLFLFHVAYRMSSSSLVLSWFNIRLSYTSRVSRTANCVSITSNSLQANCTSPAARGISSPCPHSDSTTTPAASASRFRTRKPRTGMPTSTSTGRRAARLWGGISHFGFDRRGRRNQRLFRQLHSRRSSSFPQAGSAMSASCPCCGDLQHGDQ